MLVRRHRMARARRHADQRVVMGHHAEDVDRSLAAIDHAMSGTREARGERP